LSLNRVEFYDARLAQGADHPEIISGWLWADDKGATIHSGFPRCHRTYQDRKRTTGCITAAISCLESLYGFARWKNSVVGQTTGLDYTYICCLAIVGRKRPVKMHGGVSRWYEIRCRTGNLRGNGIQVIYGVPLNGFTKISILNGDGIKPIGQSVRQSCLLAIGPGILVGWGTTARLCFQNAHAFFRTNILLQPVNCRCQGLRSGEVPIGGIGDGEIPEVAASSIAKIDYVI